MDPALGNTPPLRWSALARRAEQDGLQLLGVAPLPEASGAAALIGPGPGAVFSEVFERSAEALDGAPHPIDRWSRRVGDAMAAELGAVARYPFEPPSANNPPAPFIGWALASKAFWGSPIGMLVHHQRGLWGSFRCALVLPAPVQDDRPETERPGPAAPCETCAEKPCLSTCPVSAFVLPDGAAHTRYETARCIDHLSAPAGAACLSTGCLARAACPVGAAERPAPAQAERHMRAFLTARRAESG